MHAEPKLRATGTPDVGLDDDTHQRLLADPQLSRKPVVRALGVLEHVLTDDLPLLVCHANPVSSSRGFQAALGRENRFPRSVVRIVERSGELGEFQLRLDRGEPIVLGVGTVATLSMPIRD